MFQLKNPPLHPEAWERFLQLGAPTKKHEVYRYVRLKELYHLAFDLPLQMHIEFPIENNQLVFVNGAFQPELSRFPSSVVCLPLSHALNTYNNYLKPRIHKLNKEEKDPFALLNSAYFSEGLFLYFPPKCILKDPLHIIHYIGACDVPTLLSPRIHLFAGKAASAQLTFSQKQKEVEGVSFINTFMDFALEDEANLTTTLLSDPHESSHDFLSLRASLKERSFFKSVSIAKGAATSRQDYHLLLQGEEANASLFGVWDLNKQRQHHVNVFMDHQQPQCISLQKFKGIVRDHSLASFEGKIYVHPQAQKTEAYQMNNNLILSENASTHSKPNLEIFADDVKASHGTTIGQLEEDQRFYLTARGIPDDIACNLLVGAFVQEILDLIEDPNIKARAMELFT